MTCLRTSSKSKSSGATHESRSNEETFMTYKKYTLDFTNVKYFLEVHYIIKTSLDFPDYYGCNWSAFWDCLTDMYGDPIHIEIIGLDVIEKKFDNTANKMIEILRRFKHFNNDLFADIIKIKIVRDGKRSWLE